MAPSAFAFPTLPLVGRTAELDLLRALLDAACAGRGGTMMLAGESGAGKSRLVRALAEEMGRRGGTVAVGRGYPVETGVPYALFSDALLPTLRALDPGVLATLTRGGEPELRSLFPALAGPGEGLQPTLHGEPAELKTRLLWNFAQFLGRFAARSPLLLVLEDLQWADPSTLELLHFVARQISAVPIAIVCTYNTAERDRNPTLRTTEQSLVSLGAAHVCTLEPLTHTEVGELVRQGFGVDEPVTRELTALLFGWTRGNPFFVEEALKTLVGSGRLFQREGAWLGWEVDELELPRSVRDAVLARTERLSAEARRVADLAAVIGTRVSYDVLEAVGGLGQGDLLEALDELRRDGVLSEGVSDGSVIYDFCHPVLRDTLYTELGMARARVLHATVAAALERFHGDASPAHADELALHFLRAGTRDLAGKAARYLAAAGRSALAQHANREAAGYLAAALEQAETSGADEREIAARAAELARARQRLGEYAAAIELWKRSLRLAQSSGDSGGEAAVRRQIGLALYWSGRHEEALERYAEGVAAAERAGDDPLVAKLKLARGMCLQELGRPADAQREVGGALLIARDQGDPALLARVHRALLLLHAWTGPAELAREHGERAVELATESGETSVACTTHWALAMLAGFTGDSRSAAHHIARSEALADELHSPLQRLWTSELALEYAAGTGDWDAAVALGERSIALGRSLGQKTLLPRLLVWTALVYLSRGDEEQGRRYAMEAWEISGAGGTGPVDVHTAVPAHTAMAAYYLSRGEYERAIEIGEAGLAIADRSGYVVWALHRLLPVVAEAALWSRDVPRARRVGERLRKESTRLGNKLGLAWADACDALVLRLHDDSVRPAALLRSAVEELEAIPFPVDAARLRRWLGIVLKDTGHREEAIAELRRAHDVFARVGAGPELERVRENLREAGARLPHRGGGGSGALSAREVEIVRMVTAHRSNKAIGNALEISPRTVSTHLSNIFRKLGVASRAELADAARRLDLGEG